VQRLSTRLRQARRLEPAPPTHWPGFRMTRGQSRVVVAYLDRSLNVTSANSSSGSCKYIRCRVCLPTDICFLQQSERRGSSTRRGDCLLYFLCTHLIVPAYPSHWLYLSHVVNYTYIQVKNVNNWRAACPRARHGREGQRR
jgi:hypothetical protein